MPPVRLSDVDASMQSAWGLRRSLRYSVNHDASIDSSTLTLPQGNRGTVARLPTGSSKENQILPAKGWGGPKLPNANRQSLARPILLKGQTLRPTAVFDTFWQFATERKAIDDRRRAGMVQP